MGKYQAEVEPGHQNMSQSVILDLVGRDKRVLDVGCAGGYLARALVRQNCAVSGVEGDASEAQAAKDDLEKLVVGDLEDLDLLAEFGTGGFDAVVFGDVLEHLSSPVAVLRQARALLAPRGVLVVSIPNVAHGDLRLSLLAGRWDYRSLGLLDETHLRFYTRAGVDRLMASAGFTIGELRRVTLPLFGTEMDVRREEFAPDVIAAVEKDSESETYQFVFRAYFDDLDGDLARLRIREDEHLARIGALERRVEALTREGVARTAANVELDRLRVAAERELETIRETRSFRYTSGVRRMWALMRRQQK